MAGSLPDDPDMSTKDGVSLSYDQDLPMIFIETFDFNIQGEGMGDFLAFIDVLASLGIGHVSKQLSQSFTF